MPQPPTLSHPPCQGARAAPLVLAAACALLAACATPPAPAPAESPGAADVFLAARHAPARTAPRAAPAPTPGALPSFASVVQDAQRIEGPVVLWQKEDQVWIELGPAQFNQPFLLSPKIRSGIGEAWVLGGLMPYPVGGAGGPQVVEFVRLHKQVRLQARNLDVVAAAGTPEARAVESSYSASLLGSVGLASAEHPVSKAVLVPANGLFLPDLQGVAMMLQRGYRQGYALDVRNSAITAVRSSAQAVEIETQAHFYTATLASSDPDKPGPAPRLPQLVPDARSLLVGLHYSLAPLPATPMAPRRADPRLGHFTTSVVDFSTDLPRSPRQRYVHRWRLDKQDPDAALSEPVKPITFWIDRNVPAAYRDTVRSAILEWNKAFEAIGLRNAIVVQQSSDDAAFDTLDFGYSAVRWLLSSAPAFNAIGQTHVDPRSGEILHANIGFEGMSTRLRRAERSQLLAPVVGEAALARGGVGPDAAGDDATPLRACRHGDLAAEQLGYALDVMAARDELDPGGPVAQRFVLDYVKDTVMHEVGHALGLRHNFRASRIYTEAQLADPAFTAAHGTTGSVMEYNAINLARAGEPAGQPFQTTLGPYDYWAIEYAYRVLPPGTTAEQEAAALQRIAARSAEPQLAFGTDEDHHFGLDPETLQLDLGADPIAFAAKRLDIARDLFRRQERRVLPPDRDYAVLRRSLNYALSDIGRSVGLLARQIGGVRTLRDFPDSGRDPLQPVGAAVQRQALVQIVEAVLAADGLTLSPALQRRLAPDFLDRGDFGAATDFALPQRVLELQRGVVALLMSDAMAARVLDSAGKFDDPAQALPLAEVYARVQRAVWSGLDDGGVIAVARRELQREHLNRLAAALLRPSPQARADARGLLRRDAQALLPRLEAAARRAERGADAETRAHLLDSVDSLRQALAARLPRLAV